MYFRKVDNSKLEFPVHSLTQLMSTFHILNYIHRQQKITTNPWFSAAIIHTLLSLPRNTQAMEIYLEYFSLLQVSIKKVLEQICFWRQWYLNLFVTCLFIPFKCNRNYRLQNRATTSWFVGNIPQQIQDKNSTSFAINPSITQ